jgi:hypothetical protein
MMAITIFMDFSRIRPATASEAARDPMTSRTPDADVAPDLGRSSDNQAPCQSGREAQHAGFMRDFVFIETRPQPSGKSLLIY